jgi:hypothetical protein
VAAVGLKTLGYSYKGRLHGLYETRYRTSAAVSIMARTLVAEYAPAAQEYSFAVVLRPYKSNFSLRGNERINIAFTIVIAEIYQNDAPCPDPE